MLARQHATRLGGPGRPQAAAAGTAGRPSTRAVACRATHRVAVLAGDGIGPEITSAALPVLTAAGQAEGEEFTFINGLIGGAAIDHSGTPLPDDVLNMCKSCDSVLLAAIGGSKWDSLPPEKRPERGLLGLRAGLNAFANLRPAIVPRQLANSSPLKYELVEGVDILIVRELVGGIYFGSPRGISIDPNTRERVGFNTDIYKESEVERIARVAFQAAEERGRRLCSVDKANVLEVSQVWRDVVTRVHKDYRNVELTHMYVDNAAMQLIRSPKSFDVIVTSNLFGDILSDEASMLAGSLGLLPSASVSSDGPGIFEPVHGSAPDIAGQDVANPLAMVLSAAMMCRYGLFVPKVAARLEAAVDKVLDQGYRTADIFTPGMKQVKCSEMGKLLQQAVATP